MIELRSPREIGALRQAGQVVALAHQRIAKSVCPGITTQSLDDIVRSTFAEHDATPLFLGYPGNVPFPACTCISVNEEVVHGIPGPRQLREGDIVSIDTGCRVAGWCGDAAWTHPVGTVNAEAAKLLAITRETLQLAINCLDKHAMWSQVAAELQEFVESAGFSVIEQFVGHGIGREMHEEPQVPNFVSPRLLEQTDFRLRKGLVLAIEPMVAVGTKAVRCLPDHWTQVTKDRHLAAHFEHTVALTSDGPQILTDWNWQPSGEEQAAG